MPAEIVLQQSPELPGLLDQRQRLDIARTTLAGREADLAQLRTRLKIFDSQYLRQVGILYAELDELEARICEREVSLYDSEPARRRAREARQRAEETQQAAHSGDEEPEEIEPPTGLKSLFREVARRIHPDFARDETERDHLTRLMARANQAYSRGDDDTLRRMLDDQLELQQDSTAELLARQLAHAVRDLASLDAEQELLLTSEIGQLFTDAEAAALEGRDLLAELAQTLRAQIADALYRFDFTDRQIAAHGK